MKIRFAFLSLFIVVRGAVAASELGPPEGVSEEDWKAYLNLKKDRKAMLKKRFENELRIAPPLPPWKKHPDHQSGSMFWRMGVGEEYLTDYFSVYLKYASEDELKAYKLKYPAPRGWQDWYKEN